MKPCFHKTNNFFSNINLVNQEHTINSFKQMKNRGPERKRLECQKRAIAPLTPGDKQHNSSCNEDTPEKNFLTEV